jgi:hypothetical protein
MANELIRAFSKEEVQMAKNTRKSATSHDYKRNANQNHIKIPPYSC